MLQPATRTFRFVQEPSSTQLVNTRLELGELQQFSQHFFVQGYVGVKH